MNAFVQQVLAVFLGTVLAWMVVIYAMLRFIMYIAKKVKEQENEKRG